jgi:hypothetical protein
MDRCVSRAFPFRANLGVGEAIRSLENIWAENVTHRGDDPAANHCNGQFRGGGK